MFSILRNLKIVDSHNASPLGIPCFSGNSLPKILPEQKRIVAKLDVLSAETKKLEEVYTQKVAALNELRQSVLQKAFAGET